MTDRVLNKSLDCVKFFLQSGYEQLRHELQTRLAGFVCVVLHIRYETTLYYSTELFCRNLGNRCALGMD